MSDVRFAADIAAIRDRVRQKTGHGPVTSHPAVRTMLEYRLPERRLLPRMPVSEETHADAILRLLGA